MKKNVLKVMVAFFSIFTTSLDCAKASGDTKSVFCSNVISDTFDKVCVLEDKIDEACAKLVVANNTLENQVATSQDNNKSTLATIKGNLGI